MNRFLLLILSVFLASCAATGNLFQKLDPPSPGQSVVYVFRTQNVTRSMDLSPGIAVNGKEVGALPLDGYLRIQVPAGATEVGMLNRIYLWPNGSPLRNVKLEARPGATHFVEFSVDSYRYVRGYGVNTSYIGVQLREVSEETAMRFLPKLKDAN